MKELLVLAVVYLIFLFLSLFLRKLMIRINKRWLVLIIPIYLISIYFYFDLIVMIHQNLRNDNTYIEFGHSGLLLLQLCGFSYITAIALIVNVFYQRYKSSNR